MTIFLGILVVLALLAILGQFYIMHLLINRIDELVADVSERDLQIRGRETTIYELQDDLDEKDFNLQAAYMSIEMLVADRDKEMQKHGT